MAHRTVLSARQRTALFDLPTSEASLLQHYTLADDDIEHIRGRRRPENQIGFALQLCAFRYPGRLLKPGEVIPEVMSRFIAAQLGLKTDDLVFYATRENTRHEHLGTLRKIYGYKMCTRKRAKQMKGWLYRNAEAALSSENLVRGFVEECRSRQIILPGLSTIERLCADALVAAECRIENRIAARVESSLRTRLNALLSDNVDGRLSRFIWLRQFEVGKNSADINRLLDRLECLQDIALPQAVLDDIPSYQITRLRRQGERYFTDGLRDITSTRRLAILAVCAVEWAAAIADAIVETHDRIVGTIWREATRVCEARVADAQADIDATLAGFETLGTTLLLAKGDDVAVAGAVDASGGWGALETLVANAGQLRATVKADTLDHIEKGYHRFKLYARRMLKALNMSAATALQPLFEATSIIRKGAEHAETSLAFLQPRSKWRKHFSRLDTHKDRLWIVAVRRSAAFLKPPSRATQRKVRICSKVIGHSQYLSERINIHREYFPKCIAFPEAI